MLQPFSKSWLTPNASQSTAWHMDSLESEKRSVKLEDNIYNLQNGNSSCRSYQREAKQLQGATVYSNNFIDLY